MISERISDDIPPQMTNLNMVIPVLMYFLTFSHQNQAFASKHKLHERHISTMLTNHKRRCS